MDSLPQQTKIVHDRPPMLAIGVMIWLGSEVMFFSGLFAALFTIRAHLQSWPPADTKLDVLQAGIFTLILVSSSFTMQWAVWQQEHDRRRVGEAVGLGDLRARGDVPLEPDLRVDAPHDEVEHQLVRLDLLHHDGPARAPRVPWASSR